MDIRNIKVDYATGRAGSLWQEFKAFAFKGNLIDLAVAVVIGTAFGAVVSSLVKNVIMKLLEYVSSGNEGYTKWTLGKVEIGAFLGELVNFLIIAAVVFVVIVKLLGSVMKKPSTPAAAPSEPTTKECPFCLSIIPLKARRCAHCTSDVSGPETAPGAVVTSA